MSHDHMHHHDYLIEIFDNFGSPLRLWKITEEFENVLRKYRVNIPRKARETVSRTLQDHCKKCAGYRSKYDLFEMPEGKGQGIWGVRREEVDRYIADRNAGWSSRHVA